MQITGKRVFSAVVLVGTFVTTYQLLSKPQPVATALPTADAQAAAQSFDQKIGQFEAPRADSIPRAELHFTSDEVNAEIAETTGTLPVSNARPNTPMSPDTVVGQGSVQIKSYQVKLDGNVVRGQFVAKISGVDVYVTLAGHLGSNDGYMTFEPTEFKLGELNIPISLVNSALQKKLAEQRDMLKLPEGVESLRIENGELILVQK